MNFALLQNNVQEFICRNLKTDITQLILKGSPIENIQTTELIEQLESKKKCEKKLPSWFLTKNIYYPNKLNIEQTSSEATAAYKSTLINGETLIDVTGGFGVDDFAFSKRFKNVTHCELNDELSAIVQHNLKQFEIENTNCVQGDGIAYVLENTKKYDWIYIDPSRRNDAKGKVFLLKDCLPNVPLHLNALLEKSNNLLIKNSPLIDLTSCINELKNVKEIHIIALFNEVKEVLVIVEKDYNNSIKIIATNLDKQTQHFNFTFQQEYEFTLSKPLNYLYEPNSAILKSGGFTAVSAQFQIDKLHQHSHLYTSENLIDFPGRRFKVRQTLPYQKKLLLKYLPEKKANITTRNFKENVASIRKKTGIKDGGTTYLFFTTNLKNEQIVMVCDKM
ncbi:THUMP-like domain-containing protein [Wenyingzhuangia sp. 2_MG-2023]|uniref:THUMP-like domain-containing protein n=1 Tax=Wenyingzhuangia sp. 2_MG-2023 TaxID=3062639 RepID=UPI0026E299AE|nr:RsmD family RNA methyltransferase [Wenyingzhuangia sp. 2_MG-2023]MDO6736883.1 RsmD family RNA methyltransferase [Wenyingzhuangia sp. 2_MG-2023]